MSINEILDTVRGYSPDADLDVIVRAYLFSAQAHRGQTRKSGEDYLIHPIAVAQLLADLRMDIDTIATDHASVPTSSSPTTPSPGASQLSIGFPPSS